MTTPPTPQDPREIPAFEEECDAALPLPARNQRKLTCFTDEGLAVHDVVIRQQVAEEIAEGIERRSERLGGGTRWLAGKAIAFAEAAAIARSHSTQPGEETNG